MLLAFAHQKRHFNCWKVGEFNAEHGHGDAAVHGYDFVAGVEEVAVWAVFAKNDSSLLILRFDRVDLHVGLEIPHENVSHHLILTILEHS